MSLLGGRSSERQCPVGAAFGGHSGSRSGALRSRLVGSAGPPLVRSGASRSVRTSGVEQALRGEVPTAGRGESDDNTGEAVCRHAAVLVGDDREPWEEVAGGASAPPAGRLATAQAGQRPGLTADTDGRFASQSLTSRSTRKIRSVLRSNAFEARREGRSSAKTVAPPATHSGRPLPKPPSRRVHYINHRDSARTISTMAAAPCR